MKTLIYEIVAAASTIETAGNRLLKRHGLTTMTFNILGVLVAGPLSQRQISERMIVAASSITFQMRQLQRKGLVQRRRTDARTWGVSLTPLGRETRRTAEAEMDGIIGQLQVDPDVVASTEAALRSIRAHLQAASTTLIPA